MTMRWWIVSLAVGASACVGEGYVLGWGVHEQRIAGTQKSLEQNEDWEFQVTVPAGVDRERLALAAEHSLLVGRRVSVTAPGGKELATLSGLDDVAVGAEARVGAVYGGTAAPIAIGDDAVVEGFVRANTTMAETSAHIELGVLTNLADRGEYYRWRVDPGNPRPFRPKAGAVEVLAPGAYTDVTLESGSEVVLRPGHYSFRTLKVGAGTLRIEDDAGPVYVWVERELVLAEVPRCSAESKFLLGYHGDADVVVPAGFCGTLVAPFATLRLDDAKKPYAGAFFGRSIVVADGVTIHHHPFTLPKRRAT